MDWPLDRDTMQMFLSPEGLCLVIPLANGHMRIIATVPEAPSTPSLEDVQHILYTRGPEAKKARVTNVVWSTRFRIQHRVATALHNDRIFICGDAAHVHSPAGGQGMNTGIQDAVSLAGVLHQAVTTGDTSHFAEWEKKRLAIARSVVSTTDTMTRIAATDSKAMHFVRNAAMAIIGHMPFLQHGIAERLSEIDNK
jgi:2-polyprenyl-6-methoxyphenol hydroxylase-like FAD-dependent oxidoreductase